MRFSALVALAAVMGSAGSTAAQELPCHDLSEFPCAFPLPDLALQRSPAVLQFQARIAQSKLPMGQAVFDTLVVKLLSNSALVCVETVKDVRVRGGVLNLTLGRDMSCELAEVLAQHDDLSFQVCLGGNASCLKPIALSTVPYAIKATYASLAQQAVRANIAGQAVYAHRGTADRELYLRESLGAGYFDFYSHVAKDALALYAAGAFAPYLDSGFIQWTPARDPTARRLHLAGKRESTGQLAWLNDLLLVSRRTVARGDLQVGAATDDPIAQPVGVGLSVASGGLHVTGDSDVTGDVSVTARVTAEGLLTVTADVSIQGKLTVESGATVTEGGVHVAEAWSNDGPIEIAGGVSTASTLTVGGNSVVVGTLTASSAQLLDGLTVQGTSTGNTLATTSLMVDGALGAGSLTLSGGLTVGGSMTVTGSMEVLGPTVIAGVVTFDAGFTEPLLPPDERYALAANEPRDLTFGGAVSFAQSLTLGGPLDLAGHTLIGGRVQSAASAPVACGPLTEGFFYLDTTTRRLTYCIGGVYKPLGAVCGNSYVSPLEACDDGNTLAGDGCSPTCALEAPGWVCSPTSTQPTACAAVCGDGWIRAVEGCDDHNIATNDGCNAACQPEAGWTCTGEPSSCVTTCGDGVIAGVEVCDDGDAESGDGCSSGCTVEPDWTCTGQPSTCIYGICGDGKYLASKEQCDDGNLSGGDGCNAACQTEVGYGCTKVNQERSVCSPVCGDGLVKPGEACDDGNANSGDGCSATCQPEGDGWVCNGYQPTQCGKCGDSVLQGFESCEDGNKVGGDGCSALCQVEYNSECYGAIPMKCFTHGSKTFTPLATPDWQYFQTPLYAKMAHVIVCGGGGGSAGSVGPAGGSYGSQRGGVGNCMEADIDISPSSSGASMSFIIGTKGKAATPGSEGTAEGGRPGGGTANGGGGGGGGYTHFRAGNNDAIWAGGGGGAGGGFASAWPIYAFTGGDGRFPVSGNGECILDPDCRGKGGGTTGSAGQGGLPNGSSASGYSGGSGNYNGSGNGHFAGAGGGGGGMSGGGGGGVPFVGGNAIYAGGGGAGGSYCATPGGSFWYFSNCHQSYTNNAPWDYDGYVIVTW